MGTTVGGPKAVRGNYGEAWVDNMYKSNVKSVNAKLELKKEEVSQPGKLISGQVIVGANGKGTVKLYKVDSRFTFAIASAIEEGRTPSFNIMSKVDDPDVVGAETVYIKDCIPDNLTLADWENGKVAEEEIPFTFSDWEFMDFMEV